MPDRFPAAAPAPANWSEAVAALPMADAPGNGWARVAAQLERPARPRLPAWMALAAALVLALALPWKLIHDPAAPVHATNGRIPTATTHGASLETLYAESAQLEALLAYARDDRVSSGSAAALSVQLDGQLASIDAALAQPGLSPAQQRQLWRQRVETLRSLTGFESTRRLLTARGERYDGALVRVD